MLKVYYQDETVVSAETLAPDSDLGLGFQRFLVVLFIQNWMLLVFQDKESARERERKCLLNVLVSLSHLHLPSVNEKMGMRISWFLADGFIAISLLFYILREIKI